MNYFSGRFLTILFCLLSAMPAGAAERRQASAKPDDSGLSLTSDQGRELLEVLRSTRQFAEQAQSELRQSREQNEMLQRSIEEIRKEVIRLREEVSLLRSGTAAAQINKTTGVSTDAKERGTDDSTGRAARAAEETHERLTRIEDRIELNTAQIKEQSQTKVESNSRFKLSLYGSVLSNTYFNTHDSSENAAPRTALPESPYGKSGSLGSTLRQTQLGLSMIGPKIGDARLSADVDFDFFGGAAGEYENNVLGALRMRTASVILDGPRTSFAAGLMSPMISPLNPASLAAVYYPALGESGNLWQWRPQMIFTRRTSIREGDDLILQAGLMMPFGETVYGIPIQGRPGYETRIAFAHGPDSDRRTEIGFGAWFDRRSLSYRRTVDSYAATSDWSIPLNRRLTLSGEAFYGRSITLGQPGGGDISGAFAFTGPLDDPSTSVRGIHSAGGWFQLGARATSRLEFNFAFGVSDPRNRDLRSGLFDKTTLLNNQTFSVNSIYHLRSDFAIAFEYRRLRTNYPGAATAGDHLNLALGFFF